MPRSLTHGGRRAVAGAAVLLAVGLAAAGSVAATDPSPSPNRGFLEPSGTKPRVAAAVAEPAPGFQDVTALSGLRNPTNIEFTPDGRLVVAEKRGRVLLFDSLADTTPTELVAIDPEVLNYWDRGLLGMTLSPGFGSTNPSYVYISYTYDHILGDPAPAPRWNDACPDPPGPLTNGCVASGRLSRFPVSATGVVGAEQVLIEEWCQQFPSHSMGDIAFGPDGFLYASAGEAASFGGLDYGQNGNPCGDPPQEGGSLRSQSIRGSATNKTLDGTVIRLDPATGAAAPGNPNAAATDPDARRIVVAGLRNPFRFTFRPGAAQPELWIGDVGESTWEEINRIVSPAASIHNTGWPCYEGAARHPGWVAANLPLCNTLYTPGDTAVTAPYFQYGHGTAQIVPGETCPGQNGSVISGVTFYGSGTYPAAYQGALFFADHSRNCVWAMQPATTGGVPSPTRIVNVVSGAAHPVDLEIGPAGDVFYVDFDGGTIHRISWTGANQPPIARATAVPLTGTAPLDVTFDGSGSSDAEGAITYDWNFGDGTAHATSIKPVHTYAAGTFTATLTVTDRDGASDVDTLTISASNSPPVPTIATPSSSLRWVVGQTISFTGGATDEQDGTIPASALEWRLVIDHCNDTGGCHEHIIQTWNGVASGSFDAPDHAYPSHLELQLTATDANGVSATRVLQLDPATVDLSFYSTPSGAPLTVGLTTAVTPFTRTVIVGSRNTVVAPTATTIAGAPFEFASWSDGGDRVHDIVATSVPASYTARFEPAEAPDTCAGARPIASGVWTSEKIDPAGDLDWYSLTLSTARDIRVVLGRLDADLRLDLYSGCSTLIASSSHAGTQYESIYKRLSAGTYRLRVSGVAGAVSKTAYALQFRALSDTVQILTSSTWTASGSRVIVGMVLNNTPYYQRSIVVKATLLNASNVRIGTVTSAIYAPVLNPRTQAPFRLAFHLPPGYARATITVSATRTTLHALAGMTVTAGTRSVDSTGRLHVRGTVRNGNTFTVTSTRVAVALIDNVGVVRNVVNVAPATTTLGPGKTSSFDAVFADHASVYQVVSFRATATR
ncbi:MAG TPA: PQQ-dependent sugar dehydrogenase [Candidatus Limnocylindrales bacterium]|nr:PQQ-dependent sugar dehydrogenase [Candidatus Limnocylindrales bacterium]